MIGKVPWERNPRVCTFCGKWLAKMGPGGAEVELTLLFADIRGYTGFAESRKAEEIFSTINRYTETSRSPEARSAPLESCSAIAPGT